MMDGETVATGAQTACLECGTELTIQVCHSAAGYYIGYWCNMDGPHSRESGYYKTTGEAQTALEKGGFERQ